MKTRTVWLLVGAVPLLVLGIVWALRTPAPAPRDAPNTSARTTDDTTRESSRTTDEASEGEPTSLLTRALLAKIAEAAQALRDLPPGLGLEERQAEAAAILRALRTTLATGDLGASVAAILAYLQSGADAISGLPFRVSEGGSLESAPSLRAFLLDVLGTIDPIAAADFSRDGLRSSPESPEETALGLRNLVWGSGGTPNPTDRQLIVQNVAALLDSDTWRSDPSAGYLESFDAAVFLSDPETTARLAAVAAGRGPSSAAALLALERIAQAGNPDLLRVIADPASPMAAQPAFRAELLARAEVSDPAARAVVEEYLSNPSVSTAEKEVFLAAFPLRSQTEGPRLITEPQAPANLPALDRAALEVLRTWHSQPAFGSVQPAISSAIARIGEYLP